MGMQRLKELIDLISHLTLPKLLADWKQWFNAPDDEAEALASRKKLLHYLKNRPTTLRNKFVACRN